MQDDGAGAGQDDGQPGSGAPGGGSPEGGSENDDKPITAKQLKAALESQKRHYEGQLAGQRAEFEAFKQGVGSRKEDPPADKPKRFTRAQLKTAVDAGQITQEQADDHLAEQMREDAKVEAVAAATAAVAGRTHKERIDTEIESYKRLKPDIMTDGTELREKIKAEFQYLVGLGSPGRGAEALPTQLAAIRAVLGPLDKLEKAAGARRPTDSHQDTGGGEGGGRSKDGGGGNSGKALHEHLKGDAKAHYEEGIKKGRYKDWKDVDAELKYASPGVKRRLGLPA